MEEYRQFSLRDICIRLNSGKSIPSCNITPQGSVPVYGGNGVRGYTTEANFEGECAIIGRQGAFCGNVRYFFGKAYMTEHAVVVCANDQHNTHYLAYVLSTMNLGRLSGQSAQPGLSVKTLGKQLILMPKKETQDRVVAVLSSIEDKIVENERINHNLQQQIQSLYDSWFKRFEPFKSSMQDSELGSIPSNWQVKDIYSIASIIYGAPFSSKLFNTERNGKPIVRIRDLKSQETNTYTTECHPKGYLLKNGDIVVGMDGEFRPYIWGSDQAWLNQRVCVFVNKRPHGKAFLLYSIKPLLNIVEQTEAATTVIHIGKQDFDAFRIVLPPDKILNAFDEITAPMYDQIVNNICENRRLGILRDTLLPKLMSGEIDISEVEI